MKRSVAKSWVFGLLLICARNTDAAESYVAGADPQVAAASNEIPVVPRAGPKYPGIQQKPVNYRDPRREYTPVPAAGWTIQVEKELETYDPDGYAMIRELWGIKE